MMVTYTVHGGGRFEQLGSYARGRRVGDHVFVAGTTAIEPSGRLHAPGDTHAQTLFVLRRIEAVLADMDASLADVVRTVAYLADISTAGEFARAHGEVFSGVAEPVSTGVGVQLTTPGMMVEIEVQAIVQPR